MFYAYISKNFKRKERQLNDCRSICVLR